MLPFALRSRYLRWFGGLEIPRDGIDEAGKIVNLSAATEVVGESVVEPGRSGVAVAGEAGGLLSAAVLVQQVLAGQVVAFTGTLASMTHRSALELVERAGGRGVQAVGQGTTLLVIGEEGWALEDDGRASVKLRQALQLVADGAGIRIVAESDWLQMLGLDERRDEIRRAHTPAMLSRMLNVPVRLIRRWARLGLLRPVRTVGRLPWFDYREAAGARRLAGLLGEGVSADVIERSLGELSRVLAGTDRSLAQLNLLVHDDQILLRDERGVLNPRTGQRLLDFEGGEGVGLRIAGVGGGGESGESGGVSVGGGLSEGVVLSFAGGVGGGRSASVPWTADEWFHEGCRLSESGEFEAAVTVFRRSLCLLGGEVGGLGRQRAGDWGVGGELPLQPDPADVNFHLADALYRGGRLEAAVERYYCAVEWAPEFIEAWAQLGCLQAELEEFESAEESLRAALAIHASNPDVLLSFAQLLDRLGREGEAVEYWRQYLQFDSRGPWSEHARMRAGGVESSSVGGAGVGAGVGLPLDSLVD